jgi:hypothetical protein
MSHPSPLQGRGYRRLDTDRKTPTFRKTGQVPKKALSYFVSQCLKLTDDARDLVNYPLGAGADKFVLDPVNTVRLV